jgi:hypothetical protein
MDTRVLKRWDANFILVTVVCLLIASFSGWLLWRDFHAAGAAGSGTPLAKLERREAKVKRKARASFVWSEARANEDLYRKDSVQTSAKSAAAIRMKDGGLLEMGENSLVVIDEVGNLDMSFLRGEMTLRTQSGDQKLSVGADGKAKVENLPLRLKGPEPLAQVFTPVDGPAEIAFSWDVTGGAQVPDALTTEVSRDSSFKTGLVSSVKSTPGSHATSVKLDQEGKYYWRITSNGAPLSATGQFLVLRSARLKPSWPNAQAKVVGIGAESPIQFRWIVPKSLVGIEQGTNTEHRVQIATDAGFSSIVREENVIAASGNAWIKGLAAGEYYWRVRSRYDSNVLDSPHERFRLRRMESLALEQSAPEDNGALVAGKPARFTWTTDLNEGEYEFELQNSSQAKVFAGTIKSKSIEWKAPLEGLYRWRVAAVSGGQRLAETPWRAVAVYRGSPIALKAPRKDEEIRYWDEPVAFLFDWARDQIADERTGTYLLEVSADAQFKQVAAKQRTSSTSVKSAALNVAPGTYFWRVRYVDEKGETLKSSEVQRFAYGLHPPLRAPATAKPGPDHVFDMMASEAPPEVTWSKVDGAEGYEVTVFDTATGKPLVSKVATEPEMQFKELKEGKYTWTVRPIDQLKRKGEAMPSRQFRITYGDRLPAPEATSPEVQ